MKDFNVSDILYFKEVNGDTWTLFDFAFIILS